MRKIFSISIAFICIIFLNHTKAQENDQAALLNGIKQLPLPDEHVRLSATYLINNDPEIIAVFDLPDAHIKFTMISTSRLGKGKIMVLGSPAYFNQQMLKNPDVVSFIRNTITWGKKQEKGKTQIGLLGKIDQGLTLTFGKNYNFIRIEDFKIDPKIAILFLGQDVKDSVQLKQLTAFVEKGGTLVFGSPYHEIFSNKDSTGTSTPLPLNINELFIKAGLFNAFTLLVSSKENNKLVLKDLPAYLHPKTLFPYLIQTNYTKLDYMAKAYIIEPTIDLIFTLNENNHPIFEQIKLIFKCSDSLRIPSKKNPIMIANNQQKWAYILEQKFEDKKSKWNKDVLPIAAGAKIFPGAVPAEASRVNEKINIKVKVNSQGLWDSNPGYDNFRSHSTGFYIPPGEKVKIIIDKKLINAHLVAQIGVHHDDLMHMEMLVRDGIDLTNNFNLNTESTEIFSKYGGLLFINVADTSKLKMMELTINGAVKAPRFKLNETTEEEWRNQLRKDPAPWAELVTDKIELFVPSYRIRNLDNPAKLMKFWDEVMDADADLANISRDRAHPEKIIVDAEVAYGYMFTSHNRIVVPDDESCEWMLDENMMRTKGSWGHFHEIGHRHQFRFLDFDAVGEVTVNLYSMYVYDKVLKKGIYNHDNISSKAAVQKRIADYLANDPSFEKWSNDPFTALCMYIQLIENFGWEPIIAVNKMYRSLDHLDKLTEFYKPDQDKIDLWFVYICTATNTNLTQFFNIWKVPVSEKAKGQVIAYKTWLPAQFLNK